MRGDWAEAEIGAPSPPAVARPGADPERVASLLLVAAAAEFAALAVTGVLLLLFYRPSTARAWGLPSHQRYAFSAVGLLRFAHRWLAHAMVLTLVAIAVVGVVAVTTRSRPRIGSARGFLGLAIVTLVVGLFASFTGYLLPWDQLALWAVRIGTNMMGYRPIISGGSNLRYVLIGGATTSPTTLRWWLVVHVVLAPAVMVASGVLLARVVSGHRSRRHTGLGS